MRDAKGRNGGGSRLRPAAGVDEVLGPVDFAVRSEKSRAAARMLADQLVYESSFGGGHGVERRESSKRVKNPLLDEDQPWSWSIEVIGRPTVFRTLCIPSWMDAEDARRYLYGDE